MRLFLKFFGLHQRVPPSFVSIFCKTMDVKISQRVPSFTFFGTVTLFKNLILKNFSGNFFMSPKAPLQFFHFLQTAGVSQSPKGAPFSILSLRHGADFGRSRLVIILSFFFLPRDLTYHPMSSVGPESGL